VIPTIVHMRLPDGRWLARCPNYAAWKRVTDDQDKPGAEKSLKGHISRHMRFNHEGWDRRT